MKKIMLIFLIPLLLCGKSLAQAKNKISDKDILPEIEQPKDEYYEDIDEENDIYNNPDAVLLDFKDTEKNKLKINSHSENINSKSPDINENKDFNISPQNLDKYQNRDIYSKKSTSYSKEKNFKNMTFGAKYDNTFTPDSYNQSRTLFSKYKKNKFTLNTSYKNNELTTFGQQFRGIFTFSPEYKINDKMSFQSAYSRNISDRSNKNEIIFTLKPFKDDRVDFNLGAGQIHYEDATPSRSQFNFSTKFKF